MSYFVTEFFLFMITFLRLISILKFISRAKMSKLGPVQSILR